LRSEVQRRNILENEVPSTVVVYALDRFEHTVGVVDDRGACDLRVGDESIVAKVVGSYPDSVDSLVWRVVHEFRTVLVDILGVGDVGRDLVLFDGRKEVVDSSKGAWGDIVTADSARNCVVVDVCGGVLSNVLWPRAATVGGVVVLQIVLAIEDPGRASHETHCWVHPTHWWS
jgi:hypothetical protein